MANISITYGLTIFCLKEEVATNSCKARIKIKSPLRDAYSFLLPYNTCKMPADSCVSDFGGFWYAYRAFCVRLGVS